MAKYRKRPHQIEAVQWSGNLLSETTDWTTAAIESMELIIMDDTIHIHPNRNHFQIASPNDYIINERGFLYSCNSDAFAYYFEKV